MNLWIYKRKKESGKGVLKLVKRRNIIRIFFKARSLRVLLSTRIIYDCFLITCLLTIFIDIKRIKFSSEKKRQKKIHAGETDHPQFGSESI